MFFSEEVVYLALFKPALKKQKLYLYSTQIG